MNTGHEPGSVGTRDGLVSIMSEPGVEQSGEGMAEGLFQGSDAHPKPWACGLTMLPAYASCDTQMPGLDELSICAKAPTRYKL